MLGQQPQRDDQPAPHRGSVTRPALLVTASRITPLMFTSMPTTRWLVNAFIALNYLSHDRKKWPKSLQFYGSDIDFSCHPRDAPVQSARFLPVPCNPPARVEDEMHRPRGRLCPIRPPYRRRQMGTLANAIRPPPLSGTIKTNGR